MLVERKQNVIAHFDQTEQSPYCVEGGMLTDGVYVDW